MADNSFDQRWQVCEKTWEPENNRVWEVRCLLGNGYLGVRGYTEEPFDAGPSRIGTYVTGLFEPDRDEIPEIIKVPSFFRVDVVLDGRPLSLQPGRVSDYSRLLDMKRGVLTRSFVYTENGRSTRVVFERFVSLARVHQASQKITVTPLDWSGKIDVTLLLDADVENLRTRHIGPVATSFPNKNSALLVAKTLKRKQTIAEAFTATAAAGRTKLNGEKVTTQQSVGLKYSGKLGEGQAMALDRVISIYTSRDPDTKNARSDCLKGIGARAKAPTYKSALNAHAKAWAAQWQKSDIEIDGPAADQQAVRHSIFQLVQTCSRFDGTVSIGAKAISEGYRGHAFWDTEIFMLPFFISTDPPAARRLLEYRYHTLPGARRKAKESGFKGAMYAWESADTGDETCPKYIYTDDGRSFRVLCGELEHHITSDVVYGCVKYIQATGDEDFEKNIFAEIAIETSRFWASRCVWNDAEARYEIPHIIGPDECHEDVDNNAYSNYMAAWNLRQGAMAARRLLERKGKSGAALRKKLRVKEAEPAKWEAIADKIWVPFDAKRNIHEQHQGYFDLIDITAKQFIESRKDPTEASRAMLQTQDGQVIKQADVVALMMLWPDNFSEKIKRANFRYYEPRTLHGSSLSSSVYSVVGSDLGMRKFAYDYFQFAAYTDIDDRMGNTYEGIHAATLGGTWQTLVRGFLQLRTDGPKPRLAPQLPAKWKSVKLRLVQQGEVYNVTVTKDKVVVKKA